MRYWMNGLGWNGQNWHSLGSPPIPCSRLPLVSSSRQSGDLNQKPDVINGMLSQLFTPRGLGQLKDRHREEWQNCMCPPCSTRGPEKRSSLHKAGRTAPCPPWPGDSEKREAASQLDKDIRMSRHGRSAELTLYRSNSLDSAVRLGPVSRGVQCWSAAQLYAGVVRSCNYVPVVYIDAPSMAPSPAHPGLVLSND